MHLSCVASFTQQNAPATPPPRDVVGVSGFHPLLLLRSIPWYECVTFYPFICRGTFEFFPILAVVGKAAINIYAQVFV